MPSGSGGLDDPFDLVFRPFDAQLVPALPAGAALLLCAGLLAAARWPHDARGERS